MTGLLTTAGLQQSDWSAAYRLLANQRLPCDALFAVVRRSIASELPPEAPFCAALDDTLVRRGGRATPGVGWRRDPLGPPFQTNLVRAQRFLQLSAALPGPDARMVPIAFRHTPSVARPSRRASTQALSRYRTQTRHSGLSAVAAGQIQNLRTQLDEDPDTQSRSLCITFDGGYTNSTVLRKLPDRTTCIGRIRKDARLYFLPAAEPHARGRHLSYGAPAPTPEQLRTDETQAWQQLPVTHAGVDHTVRFKRLGPLLWRTAGATQKLQIIVIAPLKYRPRKGSKLIYRDPAYLVCTDPDLAPEHVIQTYLKRWDIEVNFRDEKTLLGVGQAQVRNPCSIEAAPTLSVLAYSFLLTAAHRSYGANPTGLLEQPKWAKKSPHRLSTQVLLHQFRAEVWALGLNIRNFSPFASPPTGTTSGQKCRFPLISAAIYANG